MRWLFAVLMALGGLIVVAGPSDAKQAATKAKKPTVYEQRQSLKSRQFDPDDPKCVIAESLDPGGTYAAMPCWARAALAPKGDGHRR